MAEVIIRELEKSDRVAWEKLWQGYLEFYESRLADEVTQTTWDRLMTPNSDPHGLVAVDEDGHVFGLVHYLYHCSTWTIGPYCYLQDLFVDATGRGKGAGRALIKAVYLEAGKYGASQVYWLTQDFNHTARKLYDDVGTLTPFIKYRGF